MNAAQDKRESLASWQCQLASYTFLPGLDGCLRSKLVSPLSGHRGMHALIVLVKPTDYVDPYGALNHFHKIPYHLSLLGSSETL